MFGGVKDKLLKEFGYNQSTDFDFDLVTRKGKQTSQITLKLQKNIFALMMLVFAFNEIYFLGIKINIRFSF